MVGRPVRRLDNRSFVPDPRPPRGAAGSDASLGTKRVLLMGTSPGTVHRRAAALVAFMTAAASALLMVATTANAATPTRVPLGTTKNFSVLGASKVTNTGASTLKLNLGISPGTSITGFPPGLVVPPASRNQTNGVAAQAQLDLTAAYVNAAGRPVQATT